MDVIISQKILITGANSFIGIPLVNKLLSEGKQVIAIARSMDWLDHESRTYQSLHTHQLDFNDYHHFTELIKKPIDTLVHLAWRGTRMPYREDESLQRLNYKDSMAALETVIKLGCRKIILAGSQAEYGKYDKPIKEDLICKPETAYGFWKLKLFEDALVLCQANQVTLQELRIFSLYGPGDFQNTLVNSILQKMLLNNEFQLTDCTQMWNFLYIKDAVDAFCALVNQTCPEGAYNLASTDTRKLKAFVEEIKLVCQSNSILHYGTIPHGISGKTSLQPDITRITRETTWKPTTAFEEGIMNTINHMKGK